MAWKPYSFVCTLHYRIIITMEIIFETIRHIKLLLGILLQVCF